MALKAVHETIEEIPEQYQDLYTEKEGRYELTGIQGVKTAADIGRVQRSLDNEKAAHKETKTKLGAWSQFGDIEEVATKLDKIPELEAASKGDLDDAAIDEIANRRAEAIAKSRIAPVERDNNKLKSQVEESMTELAALRHEKRSRTIQDAVRKELVELKVRPEYHDDAMLWAASVLDVAEDGSVLTKENVGVTPGIAAGDWLQELLPKRPDWIAPSKGGGARGSGMSAGLAGPNPWDGDSWNVTKQAQLLRENPEKAKRAAEAAGSYIGATSPTVKK